MDMTEGRPVIRSGPREIVRVSAILIGDSHFDHALGAESIAKNTGATVVGSYESIRLMAEEGVEEKQLMPVAGGEPIAISGQCASTRPPRPSHMRLGAPFRQPERVRHRRSWHVTRVPASEAQVR